MSLLENFSYPAKYDSVISKDHLCTELSHWLYEWTHAWTVLPGLLLLGGQVSAGTPHLLYQITFFLATVAFGLLTGGMKAL